MAPDRSPGLSFLSSYTHSRSSQFVWSERGLTSVLPMGEVIAYFVSHTGSKVGV